MHSTVQHPSRMSFLEKICWKPHRKSREAAEDQSKEFHDVVSQFEDFQHRTAYHPDPMGHHRMGLGDIQGPDEQKKSKLYQ